MIDVQEQLIELSVLPGHLPRKKGKKIHISTIHRWRARGIRGHKLETILVGGVRYTSLEAVNRFLQRTTSAADNCIQTDVCPAEFDTELSNVESELERLGL